MRLRTTLLAAFAYTLVIVIVVLEVPLVLNVSRRVDAEIEAESSGQAQLIATTASDQLNRRSSLQELVERSAAGLGGRVIVVDADGRVIVDSAGTGVRGDSYADRPEIGTALGGETAQGTRESESLGEELLFTAVPVVRNGRNVAAVRVTQSVDAVNSEVRRDLLGLIGIGVAALLLGLAVAWLLASFLTRPLTGLAATARRLASGNLKARAPDRGSAETRDVARAFNEMAERVESVLDAQRDFVGNASHQLRTPLTALRLRIEAAGDRSDEPEVADELREVEREVDRLSGLLDNLLTLARAGQEPAREESVSLAVAAAEAAERWRRDVEREHRLVVEGDGEPLVACSAEDLGIVLDNLIENALRYSPPGGTVRIDWGRAEAPRQRPGRASGLIAVSDEGPGLAETEREKVLDRFYRGSAAAGKSGTGLGLAIVDALARRWRGSVRLRNRAVGGLRAETRLPLAPPPGRGAIPTPDTDFDKSLPGAG